jgi:hypothetical protein
MEPFDSVKLPEEITNKIDSIVSEGRIYIAINELYQLNSTMAQVALIATLPRMTDNAQVIHGVAWSLDCYKAVLDALSARFASEIVPDTVEALEQ